MEVLEKSWIFGSKRVGTLGLCLMVADLQCNCIVALRLTHLQNSDTLDTRALHGPKISSPARKRFGPARYTAEKCRPGPARSCF